jgi:hypothetical protein
MRAESATYTPLGSEDTMLARIAPGVVGPATWHPRYGYIAVHNPLVITADASDAPGVAVVSDTFERRNAQDYDDLLNPASLGIMVEATADGGYSYGYSKSDVNNGSFVAFGSESLIVNHDEEAAFYAGPYMLNNCEFMMDLIGGGSCTPDVTPPTIESVEFINPSTGEVLTEFEGVNGEFAIRVKTSDDNVVQVIELSAPISFDVIDANNLEPYYSGWENNEYNLMLYHSEDSIDSFINPELSPVDATHYPAESMEITSSSYAWANLPLGESTFKVCVSDSRYRENEVCEELSITKSITSPASTGRIRLKLPVTNYDETAGVLLSGFGHDILWQSVFENVDTGTCDEGANDAFLNMRSGSVGFAILDEIEVGFPNLQNHLNGTVFANDYQIDFSNMTLGDDIEGTDWFYSAWARIETRYYTNPGDTNGDGICENLADCSDLIISEQGKALINAEMGMVTTELQYGNGTLCGDDSYTAHTDTMTTAAQPFGVYPNLRQQSFIDAFLADVAADGFCIKLEGNNVLTTNDPNGEFQFVHAWLNLGPC